MSAKSLFLNRIISLSNIVYICSPSLFEQLGIILSNPSLKIVHNEALLCCIIEFCIAGLISVNLDMSKLSSLTILSNIQ